MSMTEFELFSAIALPLIAVMAPLGLWLIERSGRNNG